MVFTENHTYMQIKFNRTFKSLRSLSFNIGEAVDIKNTPEEIRTFCSASPNLKEVSGGNIINNDISFMFANDINLGSVSTCFDGVVKSIGLFENCRSMGSIEANFANLRTACDITTFVSQTVGHGMFKNCSALTSASIGSLPNLNNGTQMFTNCTNLQKFHTEANKLVYGAGMFYGCTNLSECDMGTLSSLKHAKSMFSHSGIKSFSADTASLTDVRFMFNECGNLEECFMDISKIQLSGISGVFDGCTKLRRLTLGTLRTNIDLSFSPLTLKSISGIAESAAEGEHVIALSEYTKNLSGFNKVADIFDKKGWIVK